MWCTHRYDNLACIVFVGRENRGKAGLEVVLVYRIDKKVLSLLKREARQKS
jgi:hypothetical protein